MLSVGVLRERFSDLKARLLVRLIERDVSNGEEGRRQSYKPRAVQ